MKLRTCVSPEGKFKYGIHKPSFSTANLREKDLLQVLGLDGSDKPVDNTRNFPDGDVEETRGTWIYEIPNPFPFRGATYIDKNWADAKAADPLLISLPAPSPTSMTDFLDKVLRGGKGKGSDMVHDAFPDLPETVLLALASTSTDPEDLVRLAELACEFVYDQEGKLPVGLRFDNGRGRQRPRIKNHDLFEALVNNIYLPDIYKEVMVLRPGAQGDSEIVGEWPVDRDSHVFEYLRRNSYIPWGHYAANISNDLVRYAISDLSDYDFEGLRHLYYQRTFVRLAEQLGLEVKVRRKCLTIAELEELRKRICEELDAHGASGLQFDATLWGWNFGFDFTPSGYRLHASHQQVHHQLAMVPRTVMAASGTDNGLLPSYSCGDLVADFVRLYQEHHGSSFFADYIAAVQTNSRMDGKQNLPADLVIFKDEHVILFVPKAQTSQWELQLMTLGPAGNILETDNYVRRSIDTGILTAMRILTGMGARMITTIEFSKRIGVTDIDQRLLYSFLPKIPYSMGAFSEAELRYISGHYPEDFAVACRLQVESQ